MAVGLEVGLAERLAMIAVAAAALYAAGGILFAAVFLSRGLARVDPAAQGTSLGFRAMIAPGVVALWPVLWRRWRQAARRLP